MNPQLQLQKRSKELDAQQEFIESQLKFLEEAPITIKSLEARIDHANKKLEEVSAEIVSRQSAALEELERVKNDRQRLRTANERLEAEIKAKNDDLRQLEIRLQILKRAVREAQANIDERSRYLKAQEELIETTNSEGNQKLLELKSLSDELNDQIKEEKINKTSLEAFNDELETTVQALEVDKKKQIEEWEQTKKHRDIELRRLEDLLIDKKLEYQQISKEVDKKLALLKEKEASIKAKTDALILERQIFNTEKRRWESQKTLNEV